MAEGGGSAGESDSPFKGFKKQEIEESNELNSKFQMRRIKWLEEMMETMVMRVTELENERAMWKVQKEEFEIELSLQTKKLEKELREVNKEKEKLREENESLKNKWRRK